MVYFEVVDMPQAWHFYRRYIDQSVSMKLNIVEHR